MGVKRLNELFRFKNLETIWKEVAAPGIYKISHLELKDKKAKIIVNDKIYQTEMLLYRETFLTKLKKHITDLEELEIIYEPKKIEKVIINNTKEVKEKFVKKEIFQKFFEINSDKFKDLPEEYKQSSRIMLSLKQADDYIHMKKGHQKCVECGEYFEGQKCILCYNEKIEFQKQIILSKLWKNPFYTQKYSVEIDGFDKIAYQRARSEVLNKLYLAFFEKFVEKRKFNDELNEYLIYLLQSEQQIIIEMEKSKLLERLKYADTDK